MPFRQAVTRRPATSDLVRLANELGLAVLVVFADLREPAPICLINEIAKGETVQSLGSSSIISLLHLGKTVAALAPCTLLLRLGLSRTVASLQTPLRRRSLRLSNSPD